MNWVKEKVWTTDKSSEMTVLVSEKPSVEQMCMANLSVRATE